MSTVQQSDPFNRSSLRQALKWWHQSAKLGDHPFAFTPLVQTRRLTMAQTYANTASGRGIVLRQLLQDALNTIKPTGEALNYSNKQWRYYTILTEQFVNKRRAKEIRDELGISESGYFTDQRAAMSQLLDVLRDWATQTAVSPPPTSPPPTPPLSPPVQLPLQPTPFIGRQAERQQLANLLINQETHLITLLGPGGMGKTRLAIQVAEEQASHFAHGVYFVPLEHLSATDFLVPTIANAVGLHFNKQEDPQQQLIDFLRQKKLLLIMDNFEHLVESTVILTDLLSHASHLKLLVTSRERLNMRGEWVLDLRGLKFPDSIDKHTTDITNYSAIQLFLETAYRHQTSLPSPHIDIPCIGRICQLLRGLPLGIELAAGWVHLLACDEILMEIENNLDFLEGSFRDLPQRHQGLRAVFNHSWALLSKSEKALFRQLAVFRGNFTREAAQQVAGATLPLIHSLTSKSLLRIRPSGRYAIHGILRQYAAEKLQARSTEWQMAQDAHSRYFMAYIQRKTDALKGKNQKQARLNIAKRIEDIRAAWRWAITNSNVTAIHAAIIPMYLVYTMSNQLREGEEAFGQVVAHWHTQKSLTDTQKRNLGFALGIQGRFNFKLSQYNIARALFEKSLTILEALAAPYEKAFVNMLAIQTNFHLAHADTTLTPDKLYADSTAVFKQVGDIWALATTDYEMGAYIYDSDRPNRHHQAQALVSKALTLCQTIDDLWGAALCLHHLGHIAYGLGDYENAQAYTEQSLAISHQLGDKQGIANAYNTLGQVAGTRGDYQSAQNYYQQCLHIRQEFGNRKLTAECLDALGYISYLLGNDVMAEQCYRDSLMMSRAVNDVHGVGWSLHNLGDIARFRGQYEQAKHLYLESVETHGKGDRHYWGSMVSREKLGRTLTQLGEYALAEQYFIEALTLASERKRYREAIDALFGLAQLRLTNGDKEQAAIFLTVIVNHHATAREVLVAAQPYLDKLPEAVRYQAQHKATQITLADITTPFKPTIQLPSS